MRGIEGFVEDRQLHTTRILDLSFDLPIVLEVVDTEAKIRNALSKIGMYIDKGLATVSEVEIISFKKV